VDKTKQTEKELAAKARLVAPSNLFDCSRPHSLDEVGIGGLAAVLPYEHSDLSTVVDAVKSDVQRYVA